MLPYGNLYPPLPGLSLDTKSRSGAHKTPNTPRNNSIGPESPIVATPKNPPWPGLRAYVPLNGSGQSVYTPSTEKIE